MNPKQITLVEWTVRRTRGRRVEIAADFYARLFAAEPGLRAVIPNDREERARKFASDLDAIVDATRRYQHCASGAEPSHDLPAAAAALLGALAAALGPAWTPTVEAAWRSAFDVIADVMTEGDALVN